MSEGQNSEVTRTRLTLPQEGAYDFKLNSSLVESYSSIRGKPVILDNRKSKLYSRGHIPFSVNLPSATVLENGCYKKSEELEDILQGYKDQKVVVSCQQGVEACIVEVALQHIGNHNVSVYDGSYFEYANKI